MRLIVVVECFAFLLSVGCKQSGIKIKEYMLNNLAYGNHESGIWEITIPVSRKS
jgi:hypothetical protein